MTVFFRTSLAFISTVLSILPAHLGSAQTQLLAVSQRSGDPPIVKSAGLSINLDVPWSKPVKVKDPFEGEFLAVFDRNDLNSRSFRDGRPSKVISLWSRNTVRLLVTASQEQCTSARLWDDFFWDDFSYHRRYFPGGTSSRSRSRCLSINLPRTVQTLSVKVGDRVVQLAGQNSTFKVTDELATLLRNAPDQAADIRMELEGGETADSPIGKGTVRSWRSVYVFSASAP